MPTLIVTPTLTFREAISRLNAGLTLSRKSWTDKQVKMCQEKNTDRLAWRTNSMALLLLRASLQDCNALTNLILSDNQTVTTWSPDREDMLALDWYVVN